MQWAIACFQSGRAASRLRGKTGLLLVSFFGCLLFLPGSIVSCYGTTAVISIDYSDPVDISGAAKMLLTPEGRISFDRRTHSLIVIDAPQVIAEIRELVRRLDRPVPDLKIHVRLGNDKERHADELTVESRVSGPGWSVGTGGRTEDGIDVTLKQEKARHLKTYDYMVKTRSGQPAYIATGKEIPFTSRWISVCGKFGGCRNPVTYKRVETGFEVLPVVRGRRVMVSITPRISSDESGIVRFAEASTRISVPLGRWVDIGMIAGNSNEAVSAVIDSSGGDKDETFSIRLMIEKVKLESRMR